MCVFQFSSHNDVPRAAQRYRTIAAHTRHRASVFVVFVVFCMHMHSFASLIRWTPPRMFSNTAITDCDFDTTIFQLRAHLVWISWSIGSEKSFGHVPPWESNPRLPACKVSTLSTRPCSPLSFMFFCCSLFIPSHVNEEALLLLLIAEAIVSKIIFYFQPIFTWTPVKGSKANSADPDQMPHNVASDQGLHCLLTGISIKK